MAKRRDFDGKSTLMLESATPSEPKKAKAAPFALEAGPDEAQTLEFFDAFKTHLESQGDFMGAARTYNCLARAAFAPAGAMADSSVNIMTHDYAKHFSKCAVTKNRLLVRRVAPNQCTIHVFNSGVINVVGAADEGVALNACRFVFAVFNLRCAKRTGTADPFVWTEQPTMRNVNKAYPLPEEVDLFTLAGRYSDVVTYDPLGADKGARVDEVEGSALVTRRGVLLVHAHTEALCDLVAAKIKTMLRDL